MNWKVLLGIGVVILLAYLFVPNIASYSWILFVLVCPLSMMLMTAGMNHARTKQRKYVRVQNAACHIKRSSGQKSAPHGAKSITVAN